MTRIDAHHHFWDPANYDYPWMVGDALDPIRRRYAPDDLATPLELAAIDGTVLVQTVSDERETIEFLEIADRTDFVLGVVGWVDLTAQDVGDRIDALKDRRGGQWLVGIRHQVHDEPDPRWLGREDVRRGLEAVHERGLTYDLLLRAREIPAAIETARQMPEQRFVIDHIAKPSIAVGSDPEWAAGMSELSELSNVSVKLSGMVTEANWTDWTVDDLRPFVEKVRGWFGTERLMFGSDWPVCLLAASSYQEVLGAARDAVGDLSDNEADAVFGRNAQEFYGLKGTKEAAAA